VALDGHWEDVEIMSVFCEPVSVVAGSVALVVVNPASGVPVSLCWPLSEVAVEIAESPSVLDCSPSEDVTNEVKPIVGLSVRLYVGRPDDAGDTVVNASLVDVAGPAPSWLVRNGLAEPGAVVKPAELSLLVPPSEDDSATIVDELLG
jgi:hypothetical protein